MIAERADVTQFANIDRCGDLNSFIELLNAGVGRGVTPITASRPEFCYQYHRLENF